METLVLSSGGTKGVSFIGALEYLEKYYTEFELRNINTFVGTSIGGLISLLLSIGFSIDELKSIVLETSFNSFFTNVKIMNFVNTLGAVNPGSIRTKLEELLSLRGYSPKLTLGLLHKNTGKTTVFVSVDIISEQTIYISHRSYPDMPVIDAVLSSMSIPFVFPPVRYDGMVLVDGALLEPVCCNESIIGCLDKCIILDVRSKQITSVNSIGSFITKLVKTGVNNNRKIPEKNYYPINSSESNVIDANMSSDKVSKLVLEGFESIKSQLKLKCE